MALTVVEFTHPLYDQKLPLWRKCRDTFEGEEVIKARGPEYLKPLGAHARDMAAYGAYKDRALFFGAVERTVKGLVGAVMRKDPAIDVDDNKDFEELLEILGHSSETFLEMLNSSLEEVICLGREGFLVDAAVKGDELPFVAVYPAESITNWEEVPINGRRAPIMVNLKEEKKVLDGDGKSKTITRYRRLLLGAPSFGVGAIKDVEDRRQAFREQAAFHRLEESDFDNPFYFQEIWVETEAGAQENFRLARTIIPRMKGGRLLDRIPFELPFGFTPIKPPVLDLANVILSHYRNSADLEHGRHFTALPTAWAAGFDTRKELIIGAAVAWVSDDANARAGYLEFTGAGLGHIKDGMDAKENMAAVLGARFLEEQKASVEAADTHKLRQQGEGSVLARLAIALGQTWTKTFRTIALWLGEDDSNARVTLNTDFGIAGLDAPTITSLMGAVQAGLLSYDSWFYNLTRGEMIPEGRSKEEEVDLIENEGIPKGPLDEIREDEPGGLTTGSANNHTHEFRPGDSRTGPASDGDPHQHTITESEGSFSFAPAASAGSEAPHIHPDTPVPQQQPSSAGE